MVYRTSWSWWSRCVTVFVMGLASLLAGDAPAAFAQDGGLDATFGTGGKVSFDSSNTAQYMSDMALRSDGKIVVIGIPHLGPFNADGTLDQSFGNNGLVSLTAGGSQFTASRLDRGRADRTNVASRRESAANSTFRSRCDSLIRGAWRGGEEEGGRFAGR